MASFAFATGMLVGCLLILSGAQKARSGGVVVAAANYDVLPYALVRLIAPLLPWLEILIGAGLLIGVFSSVWLWAAGLLLAVFDLGILVNLLRGRDIDCGCRANSKPISWALLAQNLVLAVSCFASAVQQPSGIGAALAGHGSVNIADALALTCALVDLCLIYWLVTVGWSSRTTIVAWTQQQEMS